MRPLDSLFVRELPGQSCNICGALVSLALMGFHRDWHEAQDGRGTRFFQEAADEPSFERLLRLIADLTATPEVSARPEFVAGLRERLMAEAVRQPSG
jgi:hypothetical protein